MLDLQKLIAGVMLDEKVDISSVVQTHVDFMDLVLQTFVNDSAGTFFHNSDGTMPATCFIGDMSYSVVKECSFVNKLDFQTEPDEYPVVIDHTRVPCFIEVTHDDLRATRVYYNTKERFYVSVGIQYREVNSPFAESDTVMVRAMPADVMYGKHGFLSFWNLTRPDNDHLDAFSQFKVPSH